MSVPSRGQCVLHSVPLTSRKPISSQDRNRLRPLDMRDLGVRGILMYCCDYKCSHSMPSAATDGAIAFASRISSRVSFAKLAASATPTCGPTFIGIRSRLRRWVIGEVLRPALGRRATPQQLPISYPHKPIWPATGGCRKLAARVRHHSPDRCAARCAKLPASQHFPRRHQADGHR